MIYFNIIFLVAVVAIAVYGTIRSRRNSEELDALRSSMKDTASFNYQKACEEWDRQVGRRNDEMMRRKPPFGG